MILKLCLILLVIAMIYYAVWYHNLMSKCKPKALKESQKPLHDWSSDFLESKRKEADPFADETVAFFMHNNAERAVNHLFRAIVNNSDKLPEGSHPNIGRFFDTTAKLPDWADHDLLTAFNPKELTLIYRKHSP